MVSAPLDVKSHQVHTEGILAGKQVVGQLLAEEVVEFLTWLDGDSSHQRIEAAGLVEGEG